jgi:hypothetical protein
MKLSKALSLLTAIRFAITTAALPTLGDIIRNPTLLVRPQALSRAFMANLWAVFGDRMDPNQSHLIKPNAYGSVLDIGAGWCFFFPAIRC